MTIPIQCIHYLLEQRQERRATQHDRVTALAPYVEGEDMQDFLLTFERAMGLQRVPIDEWPVQLLKVLTGKARAALVDINPDANYEAVKEAILNRFETTTEASKSGSESNDMNRKGTQATWWIS